MKKVLLSTVCLFLSVLFSSQLLAQTAIAPNFWSGSGLSTGTASDSSSFTVFPASTTPGSGRINVSYWRRASGLTATATTAANCYNSSSWSLGTTLASAQAGNNYIYFTVTNDGTVEDSISGISLLSQVSTTGPTTVQMQYDRGAGDVNFGTSVTGYATGTGITLSFVMPAGTSVRLCPSQSITFKLYGWGGSNAAGTLRILDNSTITIGFFNAYSVTATATPNVVCSGSGVSLAGTRTGGSYGPHNYSWTGPGGFSSGALSTGYGSAPTTASGIYTLTSTDWWGCAATDTARLIVNATPSSSITVTGSTTICSYDSVLLTAVSVAGLTYQWDTGSFTAPYAIPGATNTTHYTRWAARYRVRVTDPATGCSSLTTPPITIRHNAAAPATVTASGSLAFCTGGSVTLTAASGAGYSYQWYDGATPVSGATSVAYTATTSGNYSVSITVPSGCVTTSAVFVVTEVSLPTISTTDTTTFCAGGSAKLTVSISAGATGVTVQWKRNSVNIPGANSTTYFATTSGDYTCFVNIPGSCAITTNDIVVTVHPVPTPVISFNPVNNKFTTFNYYTRYQWYLNTVTIAGATTKTVQAYLNGSYRVMVTDTFGCVTLSNPYGMYNLAVNNLATQADVRIYPNPTTDVLHIETAAEINVMVTTVEGKVVLKENNVKDVNVAGLADGLYLVTVYDTEGNRLLVEKLIKQ